MRKRDWGRAEWIREWGEVREKGAGLDGLGSGVREIKGGRAR